jgi:pyruvate dehydrogenase E2 component (dihydrolipoamide acetyltransferase)
MAELLLVPEVAAGATDVVIADWLVQPGQEFKAGDPIAVIETDKAVVEVEAEADATLLKPLVAVGSEVGVGSPMALIGSQAEVGSDLDAVLAELGASATQSAPAAHRRDVPDAIEAPSPAADSSQNVVTPTSATGAENESVATGGGRRFISPIARKLLKDAGLAIETVSGTGPNGRIVRRDVEAAIADSGEIKTVAGHNPTSENVSAPARSVHASAAEYTAIPHTRLRKAVASRLTQSKQEIPHFYVKRSAVIDDLLALRAQLNTHSPVKISVNDFIIRAVAEAHRTVPDANVIWTDDAMHQFNTVNISVAVASERGLVTPVVRGVEARSLSSISAEVKRFVEAANAGRLQQSDLDGGTISVTNLGMFGVEEFAAIINPPQSAILAVGAGTPAVRVINGEATTVTTINLVMSVDHRAIDGALAAQWMAALIEALENPLRLVV